MKTLLLTALLLWSSSVAAQSGKHLHQDRKWIGDTAFWYNLKLNVAKKMHLPSLATTRDMYHFRYWTPAQVVELWSADGKAYNGVVIDYIESSNESRHSKPKSAKLFFHAVRLDTALAKQAYGLAQTIENIPAQHSITGWEQGFDGVSYIFEIATAKEYSFNSYWTPEVQAESILEAVKVIKFKESISKLLKLQIQAQQFIDKLPVGSYSTGGYVLTKIAGPRRFKWDSAGSWNIMDLLN